MFKKEKGITLVALVVTIIILLILAGVTLSLALGNSGLFKKTQNAVDRYEAASDNEADVIGWADKYSQNLMDEYDN